MKLLGSRVDGLTLAYRVKLDRAFVAALRSRADVAREHGRAAFEWMVRVPDDDGDGTIASMRHLGPLRARWADEADPEIGQFTRSVSKVWGEIRYGESRHTFLVVNEPYFRLFVRLYAPGGGQLRDCPRCKGYGSVHRKRLGYAGAACEACEGRGSEEEPGFTIEIVWYAQTLADWGVDLAMRESAAIAALCGEVLEARLRRVDLCADVEGWEIAGSDVKRLAKRSQAKWKIHDDACECADCAKARSKHDRDNENGASVYGKGAMTRRRVTGLDVGRGGSTMCRIYDKRAELQNDERRRFAEEERWKARGWDGVSCVTRVEFQLRGEALRELGIRDPDAVQEPVTRVERYVDARGKVRLRNVVIGHRVLTANDNGEEVQATLVHRLDDVWKTCIEWVRIVVPEKTKNGNEIPVSRLKLDPRWALLHAVSFRDAREARPIRRWRPRAAASAAQALGVSLSQAGRDGRLTMLPENREAYPDDERGESILRARVLALEVHTADLIVRHLIEKYGGPAAALEHFAIRSNAALMRFRRAVDAEELKARPPPRRGPVRATFEGDPRGVVRVA